MERQGYNNAELQYAKHAAPFNRFEILVRISSPRQIGKQHLDRYMAPDVCFDRDESYCCIITNHEGDSRLRTSRGCGV